MPSHTHDSSDIPANADIDANASVQSNLQAYVRAWIDDARSRLDQGNFTTDDLDALDAACHTGGQTRQRLLYIHAATPSLGSSVIHTAYWEPDGAGPELLGIQPEPDYPTVHAAVMAGWRIIHFPQQLAPFDDKEIDILGYEFVLEKTVPAPQHQGQPKQDATYA